MIASFIPEELQVIDELHRAFFRLKLEGIRHLIRDALREAFVDPV